MNEIILVAHDIRSTHNVGAFFRTCDALGVSKIILSGYTPYPKFDGDTRLPHFADKITRQIHKTALGAESHVPFEHCSLSQTFSRLHAQRAALVGLEQAKNSLSPAECKKELARMHTGKPVALFVGNEIHGIKEDVLKQLHLIMEIPMHGSKESLNVSVATGIALYTLTT